MDVVTCGQQAKKATATAAATSTANSTTINNRSSCRGLTVHHCVDIFQMNIVTCGQQQQQQKQQQQLQQLLPRLYLLSLCEHIPNGPCHSWTAAKNKKTATTTAATAEALLYIIVWTYSK